MKNANNLIYILLLLVATLASSVSKESVVTLLVYNSEPIVITALSLQTEADAEMLTRIAMGEAIGEGVTGMVLVIETVLNRKNSNRWPNTVSGVITQRSQFNGYNTRNYNSAINKEVMQIAVSLLLGKTARTFPSTTYWFYNPTIATNQSFINSIRRGNGVAKHRNHEYVYTTKV